jgi:wobble nucleotide-excising tRNase
LFNNYNTIYLVNNKERLNKGSFIKLLIELVVKVKTFILLITRHDTYIFKRLFNKRDEKRVNLILYNVVIIKGFYINIVLKALFFKKGV